MKRVKLNVVESDTGGKAVWLAAAHLCRGIERPYAGWTDSGRRVPYGVCHMVVGALLGSKVGKDHKLQTITTVVHALRRRS